jgi:hypothetical protein
MSSLDGDKLMAQGQIFKQQVLPGGSRADQESEEKPQQSEHAAL